MKKILIVDDQSFIRNVFKAQLDQIDNIVTMEAANGNEAVGKAKGVAILAEGTSTAEAYELQKKAIGEQGVISISVAEKLATGSVKVTPDLLVQGGGGLDGLLSTYLVDKITHKGQ